MTTTGAPAEEASEVACEREDCRRIADTASDVYCEITGGRLSYPTYDARTVLAEANDYTQKLIDDEVASAVAAERLDIAEKIRANESLLNEFARDGSVAGLIAFLIESLTVDASDSPPGAVGLGLVPPGPNPTEKEGAL